jgi:hypothetical protein
MPELDAVGLGPMQTRAFRAEREGEKNVTVPTADLSQLLRDHTRLKAELEERRALASVAGGR